MVDEGTVAEWNLSCRVVWDLLDQTRYSATIATAECQACEC